MTKKKYKLARGFRVKAISLKREFFKHCEHFTDVDFGAYAEHLLGITPNRKVIYPKVSVSRTKILVADNMSGADWVERRKRKKVILQDLMDIKPTLSFMNAADDVNDKFWSAWKCRHRFTSAT